jgi:hypothetical protein
MSRQEIDDTRLARSGLSRECQIQFWCKPLECGIVTGKLLIRTLTRMLSMIDLFKGRHFDREVTIICVRWCLRFKLSFRDSLVHTTIMRWIARYIPEFESVGTASRAGPAYPGASTRPM